MTSGLSLRLPTDRELEVALVQWLPDQRWFSAKNRAIEAARIVLREPLVEEVGFVAEHLLVDVTLSDRTVTRFQVPLAFRLHPQENLAPATLPGGPDSATAYDALADPEAAAGYARALAQRLDVGPLRFRTAAGATIDPDLPGRLLAAEQSNTTVVFGESFLLKLFRRVEAGVNPDLELHRALTDAGCINIAPLVGWIETDADATLGIAQQFLANASDGWTLALGSVRDLFAEADLHADEVGTDFAGEAERLGEAVATVHADLAHSMGHSTRTMSTDAMRRRLTDAARIVPELAEISAAAGDVYARADAAGPTEVQRIHSDLHLGQALRTPEKWVLIDFEGEPVKTIDERREFDSPLRDVAGMIRSFDYAGHHPLLETSDGGTAQRRFRAREWSDRNANAFCDGYTTVAGTDPRSQLPLLRAFELDKAIYEAVYEARHRPSWLPLPLRAIRRLA